MARRIAFVVARALVAAYVLLTAAYCLLAYLPFTYHQVILGGLLPWLSAFARLHAYLYWPTLALAALTLPWRSRNTRAGSMVFAGGFGVFGVVLLLHPLLPHLENSLRSLIWGLLSLAPLLVLAALDWSAQSELIRWAEPEPGETRRLFRACLLAGAYAWVLWGSLSTVRAVLTRNAAAEPRWWAAVLGASLLFHLLLAMAVFLALSFVRAFVSVVSANTERRSFLFVVSIAGLSAAVVKSIAFAPVSFAGTWATGTAFAATFSLVYFLGGISARLSREQDGETREPLEFLLGPLRFLGSWSRTRQAILLAVVSALAAWLAISLSVMDWEYMLQKLLAVAVYACAFSFFYVTAARPEPRDGDRLLIAAAASVFLYLCFIALPAGRRILDRPLALRDYANYDASFRIARGALSPPHAAGNSSAFYSFLLNNTNIPRSTHIEPVNIELAGKLTPTAGVKPHIFIIVVDSLRRDYLSPYNPAVNFTPNIAAFARESDVARNGFTHYTGTGLSEPSIWTGAMMLHQQYITPFAPMNSLQKLLEFERYRQFITKDEILSNILGSSNLVTELDAGRATMNCRLCASLAELEGRIAEPGSTGQHLFAYTQPQDIHVSVLSREGRSVPAGESYPGFDAAVASRVRRMDECFGAFIQFLKSHGLYENSVVILTADHGDSLGEDGRWGHAYHIAPEVLRVPLIVHRPAAYASLYFDPTAPAFLTDLTPSLYSLLGHKPTVAGDLYGKPLFTDGPQGKKDDPAASFLVVSSYGPVYALLQNSAQSVYVANAVDNADYAFEWRENERPSSATVSAEMRARSQEQIRSDVSEIGNFYKFSEPAPTVAARP